MEGDEFNALSLYYRHSIWLQRLKNEDYYDDMFVYSRNFSQGFKCDIFFGVYSMGGH